VPPDTLPPSGRFGHRPCGGRLPSEQAPCWVPCPAGRSAGGRCCSFRFVCLVCFSLQGGGSVPVADVPDAPLSTVGMGVAGLDCLHPRGAAIAGPTVAVEVVAVAGVPDEVGGFEGHGRFVFHAVSLQGRCRLSGRRVSPLQLAHGQRLGASTPRYGSNAVPR